MTAPVVIDAEPVGSDEIVAIARGAPVELGAVARDRIRQGREVVDRLVDGPELVYGLNTGLGHMRNTRVPLDALRAYQPAIVAMHAGAIGEPLRSEIVRAAMAVRVAGIARGGAGASLGLAETLVAMLNARIHPIVPRIGSVGASDLMHMAAIGLVAIGKGRAELNGEVLAGAEALARAGIDAVQLEPKDGLALVSANAVSVGHAALLHARAGRAALLADAVVAVSLEAARGNLSIIDATVAAAKPVPGQTESARVIRQLLEGSVRCQPGAAESVQDPLSFRVAPQVHGALRETNEFLGRQVAIELAAMDDNPLVDVEGGRILSNGNFHPLAMALAADALRPAVAHVGQLSDRRLNHVWTILAGSLDAASVDQMAEAPRFAGLLMRYSSAARYTELRALADPVTLDVAPLDLAVEDHATNAVLAVQRSETALDVLDDLLTVELLTAADALTLGGADPGTMGGGVRRLLAELAAVRAEAGDIAPADQVHACVRANLYDRLLAAAAEQSLADG